MIQKRSILVPSLTASLCLAATPRLLAASIGLNFVETTDPGVQNGQVDSLLSGELAGAPGYSQSNWNNYGRWSGLINPTDNLGVTTSVGVAWDSANTWHNNGNPIVTGDDKLMRGYLDATGAANQPTFSSIFETNSNKPVIYLSGVSTWLSSQSASTFDVVVYFDGDTTGRVGEYWLQTVSGSFTSFTLGSDLTPHYFGRDFGDFGGTYDPVALSATSTGTADDGNYVVFSGIPATADTFLIRTEEQTVRAPISAVQIVAVPEPSSLAILGLSLCSVAVFRRRRPHFARLSVPAGHPAQHRNKQSQLT